MAKVFWFFFSKKTASILFSFASVWIETSAPPWPSGVSEKLLLDSETPPDV